MSDKGKVILVNSEEVRRLHTDRDSWRRLCGKLEDRIERLREGRRRAAQMLIEKIGAPGPESIEETAQRAADRIEELERDRDGFLLKYNKAKASEGLLADRIEELEGQLSARDSDTLDKVSDLLNQHVKGGGR